MKSRFVTSLEIMAVFTISMAGILAAWLAVYAVSHAILRWMGVL